MQAVITGGAGFVGSHLAEELLRRGQHVCVIDDLSTGQLTNLSHLQADNRLSTIIGDVRDEALISNAFKDAEVIYHLSATVGVHLAMQEPVRTLQNNIGGAQVVFREAARKGAKVVFTSTSEVYGNLDHTPAQEDWPIVLLSPISPRWAYACSKATGEHLAFAYSREQQLKVIVVRLFNTIGPRQTGLHGMVVPRFVKSALRGEPLMVYGDGFQTRTFAGVRDVTSALADLAENDQAFGRVFNIGGTAEISIGALANLIKNLTRSCSEIRFVPYAAAYGCDFDDTPRRIPDLTNLNKMIACAERYTLREMLEEIIAYEWANL